MKKIYCTPMTGVEQVESVFLMNSGSGAPDPTTPTINVGGDLSQSGGSAIAE